MITAAQKRFIGDVQYVLGVAVDGIPGDRETWPAWAAYKAIRNRSAHDFRLVDGPRRVNFVKDAQAFLGLDPNGVPDRATWAAWVRHAYPEVIAAGVRPIPSYHGRAPLISSGFNGPRNWGPNLSRESDPSVGRFGHVGVDLVLRWDGQGEPPPGWAEYHFGYRPERLFYCPPLPVYACLPGLVEVAELLPVSQKWGGPRFAVRIDHGHWPNLGHVTSWSTHHRELLIKAGDTVDADTPIARVGDMGSRGAPHDHHELWRWRAGEDLRPVARRLGVRARHVAAFDPAPLFREFRLLAECGPLA